MADIGALRDRFRYEAGKGGMDIDEAVYARAGRDPLDPVVVGSGSLEARLGFFGRDPGRTEILHGEPFIGSGGWLVRDALYRARHGRPLPDGDVEAAKEVGRATFWCNTVPYKPVGNKAWSMKVKRRFAPLIAELLVDLWQGHDLITLGTVAFDWFRIHQKDLKPTLDAYWAREDRYEATLEIVFQGKNFRLHPLPHPSPLNQTWYKRFPGLLDQRLKQLGWPGPGE